ncbi:hypothetical protein HCN51_48055 [Nonomuraea sp. FMUSA5-5]|uniref:Uncharacterized protein n=1 Tax=Nonomuraea composti TaxID=2720023 RepID=A0ABX1BJH6_9ACTN|nr:hypothetical protein [Nonomuraea sp. FMUSA5-5]NJP97097.1 hypothetical protein [Nonomuraea sp. FMUSA5-5]
METQLSQSPHAKSVKPLEHRKQSCKPAAESADETVDTRSPSHADQIKAAFLPKHAPAPRVKPREPEKAACEAVSSKKPDHDIKPFARHDHSPPPHEKYLEAGESQSEPSDPAHEAPAAESAPAKAVSQPDQRPAARPSARSSANEAKTADDMADTPFPSFADRIAALEKAAESPAPEKVPKLLREAERLTDDIWRQGEFAWSEPDTLAELLHRVQEVRKGLEIPATASDGRATELTAGATSPTGMTVERARQPGKVEISHSAAVVVGDNNRQTNDHHVQAAQLKVSLDKLLVETPAQRRALANLIKNPDSPSAAHAVCKLLPAPLEQGKVITLKPGPKPATLSGHVGERGEVVVRKSKGVVLGHGTVQRNHFHYRIEQPEALIAHALREKKMLVCELASVLELPRGDAARRKVEKKLERFSGESLRQIHFVDLHGGRGRVHAVSHGHGVMLGSGNIRKDKVHLPRSPRVTLRW